MRIRSVGSFIFLLVLSASFARPVVAETSSSTPPPTAPNTESAPETLNAPPPSESASAESPKAWAKLDAKLFPVPEQLRSAVDFWSTVYTRYDNDVVLLHDERHLHVIYAALDFSELQNSELSEVRKRRVKRQRIQKAREKYRSILASSAAGKTSKAYPNDQARVEKLFDRISGNRSKYSAARNRLRTQTCLRNRFAEAVERSGRYMDEMERIFTDKGLPIELTRLPFVESLFQTNARSSAAAGGVWQFVPATAKRYMSITAEFDERFDPLTATAAASELLSENYKGLKAWPLAITAYNHGRAGMKRAVRRLGTRDLGEIAMRYRSRTFGFASRNFYAEFVAAYLAYENRQHHFPGAEPEPLLAYDRFTPTEFVALPALAKASDVDVDDLRLLNPSLSREVWSGNLFLPRSYRLRVPAGSLGKVKTAYAALDQNRKASHQVGHRYRVRRGDTLGAIARRFGTSVSKLKGANGIRGHVIRIGQTLLIPPSRGSSGARRSSQVSRSNRVSAPPADGHHVVRSGESLTVIARRYGTNVQQLQSTNGLRSADHLRVGQRLKIPGSPSTKSASGDSPKRHVVRRGESLTIIARRYGTSVPALRRANNLRGDVIQPNQVLTIP